jgi:hypothetical protein
MITARLTSAETAGFSCVEGISFSFSLIVLIISKSKTVNVTETGHKT